jgi:RES domain-containing protein
MKGTRIVYAASSIALALLELRIHWVPSKGRTLCLYRIEVSNRLVSFLELDQLPKEWRAHPPSRSTMRLGTDWIKSRSSVGLVVPSAIVPEEVNCMLNPMHPRFAQVKVEGPFTYPLDSRL